MQSGRKPQLMCSNTPTTSDDESVVTVQDNETQERNTTAQGHGWAEAYPSCHGGWGLHPGQVTDL